MATYLPSEAAELIRLMPGALMQAIETEQAIATLDVQGDILQNVFFEGRDRDGGRIGSYSRKPMYVSLSAARARYGSQVPTSKLKGRGKNSTGSKFANGEPRASMYFSDGYAGFRAHMNRPTNTVNLKLTGNLAGAIAAGTSKNVSTIAWTNQAAAELAAAHEAKYGTVIFQPPQRSLDELFQRLRDAADRALRNLTPNG